MGGGLVGRSRPPCVGSVPPCPPSIRPFPGPAPLVRIARAPPHYSGGRGCVSRDRTERSAVVGRAWEIRVFLGGYLKW